MRPQRLLRASSTQSVCAFCACRLAGELPATTARAPLALQHRSFTTSRSLYQDDNAAAAAAPANNGSAWTGFDPNSSLTAAEQREKAMRRARREAADAAVAQQAEEQRHQREEAAAAQRQRRDRRPHGEQGRGNTQANRHQPNRRHGHAQNQNQGGLSAGSIFRKTTASDGPDRFNDSRAPTPRRTQDRQQIQRSNKPHPARRVKSIDTEKQQTSAAIPSFMKATSSTKKEEPETLGWGSGYAERRSLEYGEREPEPEFVKESATPSTTSVETDRHYTPPQTESAPGFGMEADPDPEPYRPARTDAESIHDILNVDPRSVSPPSDTTYRPDYEREAQQAPPPPRTRAKLINREQYRFTPSNDEAPAQDEWQNLRRRQSEPAVTPEPEPSSIEQDDSWIDRRFAEHQQERATRARAISTPPRAPRTVPQRQGAREINPFEEDTSQRKCGRCGEIGHVARQCTSSTNRTKCRTCGGLGHIARDCPSNVGQAGGNNRANTARPSRIAVDESRTDQRRNVGREYRDDDAVDARQEMLSRMRSRGADVDEAVEDEEPTERVLRSRKFRDDEPKKEKATRRGRRGDEEEDDRGERRSRRDRGFEDDEEDVRRSARKAGKKEAKGAEKKAQRAAERAAQQAEQKNQIKLPEFISVQNLAQALGVRYEQFVNRLEDLGYDDIFPGKIFNTEVSGMIAMEYEMEPVFDSSIREEEERDLKARPEVDEQDKDLLPTRPPVVTIMGHVDHGKTTILDYLRKSSVAAGEAGGITQHIGAFSVPLAASGKTITFLDTPGHAAFLAMRQRGANVTDIVILVVAADDSVKPQTLEAIKHAKSAGVPMLVAINKCDKESADVQRVKQDLARHGVEIEDFGGDTQVVQVSGKTGLGMDELEEAAVTLSEILDHRADTEGAVEGWVLEATTKKAGRVATVLVRRGTLRQGAFIVAGKTWARVRSLRNEAGVTIGEAGPGMPVEVDGWRDQPAAGDEVLQAPTEQKATSVVQYRLEKVEREKTAEDMEAINEARRVEAEKREREKAAAEKAKQRENSEDGETAAEAEVASSEPAATTGGRIEVPFLIKADVSGSAEAVEAYIMSISSPMVAPRILSTAVGAMHESDVELAATTQGHIIAFNLPSNEGLKALAHSKGVKVLENNIIYRVLDDVKSVLEEKLPPIVTQRVLGEAEIGAAFEIGVGGRKKMKIAGCKIRNGVIGNGTRARVLRGEEKVYDGTIASLKNVKKDVQEMRKGTECGMGFEGWEGFEVGDQIQTYEERSEKRTL